MPLKRNSLTDVGPVSGQLKSSFSNLENTQINSLSGMSGGGISASGRISGDVSNVLKNLDNTTQGKLSIGASLAASLEATGITNQNISGFLSSTVSRSVTEKKPIHKSPADNGLDLRDPVTRYPSLRFQSPDEIINRNQEETLRNSMFPPDLSEKAAAYVLLLFKSYKRPKPDAPGSTVAGGPIFLPLPENYNQTFSLNYDQKDQGFFGDARGSDVGQRIFNQLQGGFDASAAFGVINEIRNTETSEAAMLASQLSLRAGYQVLDGFSDVAGGIAKQAAGMVPNPHSSIFFKGPDLRSFTWTWRLVPRSAEEAEIIREIIRKIKRSILPKADGNMLRYPDLLQPFIISNVDLGKFKKCLVKNLTINYSAEGASAFFKDGHPVAIQLGMEFQEVEIVTRDDV